MDTGANVTGKGDFLNCISSISTRSIFVAWFSLYLLFLPVFLFVLYISFNKWKKPQSSASGGLSHSDVFTLHMVAMEFFNVIGSCAVCYACFRSVTKVFTAAHNLFTTTFTGQTLFHSLTSVERYLAVVHPVTYLRLRGEAGVTIRNISIAVVWLFCLGYCLVNGCLNDPIVYGSSGFIVSFASLPLVTYCSVRVLCVLIRPKPGAEGGQKKHIAQSKRSTVYTMVAILGALLLRMMFYVVYSIINLWFWWKVDWCVVLTATFYLVLPGSLVLPLLFLHRAGKLPSQDKK